jgi:hypothetical protein
VGDAVDLHCLFPLEPTLVQTVLRVGASDEDQTAESR